MKILQTNLLSFLSSLIAIHGLEHRRAPIIDCFQALTTELPAFDSAPIGRRLSTLTSDGMPIELSVSLTNQGSAGLRYTVEVGDIRMPIQDRLCHSNQMIHTILERIGAVEMCHVHQALYYQLFPPLMQDLNRYRFGMWLGLVHRPDRADVLRVYYNLRPWRHNIARALDGALSSLHRWLDVRQIQMLLCHLPKSARPIFMCGEYNATGSVKAKIYHRCTTVTTKQDFDDLLHVTGLGEHRATLDIFHRLIAGSRRNYPERSVTLYIGQDSRLQVPTLNLYFDLRPYIGNDRDAQSTIMNLLNRLGLDHGVYQRTLEVIAQEAHLHQGMHYHTMVGIGLAPQSMKVNVYLKPAWADLYDCSGEGSV